MTDGHRFLWEALLKGVFPDVEYFEGLAPIFFLSGELERGSKLALDDSVFYA